MTERFKQMQKDLTQELFYDFTIADYTFVKTLLFAKQNLKDEEYRLFQKMFTVLSQSFPNPDLLVYFHRNIDNLQSNIGKRGRSYEVNIKDNYLEKVQNSYFEYFRNILTFPVLIIDVSELDFINNTTQYEEIKYLMTKQYLPGVHRVSLFRS